MIKIKQHIKYLPLVFASFGAVMVIMAAHSCMDFKLGGITAHALIAACVFVISLLGIGLVWYEYRRIDYVLFVFLPIGIAMLYRITCFEYMSGDYLSCLQHWFEDFEEGGGFIAIANDIGNYNVPYLYFIAAISYLDAPDLYLYKLFSVLWDIILAWGCLRLVRVLVDDANSLAPLAAFSTVLLLPTVFMNSALWAQCDAIYGALCIHAVAMAFKGKCKTSVALAATAFSIKLQAIFLLPLWGILWLAGRVRSHELLMFPATYIAAILPAILLGKPVKDIIGIYIGQIGEYPQLTLKAPNIYQFIPNGIQCDKQIAGRIGIAAAAILVIILLELVYVFKSRLNNKAFMTMAVILCIGVPFFLPHMHERYLYLADIFTLCLACASPCLAPIAILTEFSSRASYFVYFTQRYNSVLYLGKLSFSMGFEALAMLVAFILSIGTLTYQLAASNKKRSHYRKTGSCF